MIIYPQFTDNDVVYRSGDLSPGVVVVGFVKVKMSDSCMRRRFEEREGKGGVRREEKMGMEGSIEKLREMEGGRGGKGRERKGSGGKGICDLT